MRDFSFTQMHNSINSSEVTENATFTDLRTSSHLSKKRALKSEPRSWLSKLKKLRRDQTDAWAEKTNELPLIRVISQRWYHEIMTLDQAESTVIEYNDIDWRSFVAIKRRKRPDESLSHHVQFRSNHLVDLRDMYVERNEVIFIYEQMKVSLRHITDILSGLLKAFQIVTICKKIRISLANLFCICSLFTNSWWASFFTYMRNSRSLMIRSTAAQFFSIWKKWWKLVSLFKFIS